MGPHMFSEFSSSSGFKVRRWSVVLISCTLWMLSGCAGVVTTPVHAGGPGPTALAISAGSLPSGQAKSPYSTALAASGGTAPYTWSVSAGFLPQGLTLNGSGQITGTPTIAG